MRITFIILFFLGAIFIASILWSEVASSSSLELAFFDVGQGDSVFFETPQGYQVLVDGGGDTQVLSRLGEVMPFWDKSIDLVVLTHPDADHITGLVSVLERYEVENVLWTGKENTTKAFESFEQAIQEEGANIFMAQAGQQIMFGESQVILEILYPPATLDLEDADTNETSIIAMLKYGKHRVLLPGDTIKKVERALLEEGKELRADILKIAHHGSKTSSHAAFLESVAPETAVISVGKDNRFSHPHEEVLANLEKYDIQVRRTDHEGTIIFYLK